MGQLAKQIAEKSSSTFGANTKQNPKEECKAVMTKGRMATMVENEGRAVDDQELVIVEEEEKDEEERLREDKINENEKEKEREEKNKNEKEINVEEKEEKQKTEQKTAKKRCIKKVLHSELFPF